MSVQGIGGAGGASVPPLGGNSSGSSAGLSAEQQFLNYMKETPAQQYEDSWLAAHHLTRQQLNAMPPKQREAIEKEMAADLKRKVEQQAQNGTSIAAAMPA
jgi:hypothetical protein